jgi:hypothetical protein
MAQYGTLQVALPAALPPHSPRALPTTSERSQTHHQPCANPPTRSSASPTTNHTPCMACTTHTPCMACWTHRRRGQSLRSPICPASTCHALPSPRSRRRSPRRAAATRRKRRTRPWRTRRLCGCAWCPSGSDVSSSSRGSYRPSSMRTAPSQSTLWAMCVAASPPWAAYAPHARRYDGRNAHSVTHITVCSLWRWRCLCRVWQVLGHEATGSVLHALKEEGLATSLSAGLDDDEHTSNAARFSMQVEVRPTHVTHENVAMVRPRWRRGHARTVAALARRLCGDVQSWWLRPRIAAAVLSRARTAAAVSSRPRIAAAVLAVLTLDAVLAAHSSRRSECRTRTA